MACQFKTIQSSMQAERKLLIESIANNFVRTIDAKMNSNRDLMRNTIIVQVDIPENLYHMQESFQELVSDDITKQYKAAGWDPSISFHFPGGTTPPYLKFYQSF